MIDAVTTACTDVLCGQVRPGAVSGVWSAINRSLQLLFRYTIIKPWEMQTKTESSMPAQPRSKHPKVGGRNP
jgi:hypothetical protein